MERAKLDKIIALVTDICAPAGLECIEAEWSGSERILRLFVDNAGSEGINLDGCVKASRLLEDSTLFDDMIPGTYTLEVSSPGVERPLRRRRDFEKHLGSTVQVRLLEKVQERRNGSGKLVGIEPGLAAQGNKDDSLITLETEQGPWRFPLTSLQRASLVYDWNSGSA